MTVGIKGRQSVVVDKSNTALTMGSGTIDVFATPAMTALMEKTAQLSVSEFLEPGQATVGTLLNIEHVSATPIGAKVTCESELVEIDRKKLVFKVSSYDECGVIGRGIHERFIVDSERFLKKAEDKLK